MKKVGIVTIVDKDNYGNRLQNYALQTVLREKGFDVKTIKNTISLNKKDFKYPLRKLKYYYKLLKKKNASITKRNQLFEDFDKLISYTDYYMTPFKKIESQFDDFITGSDQVWNPTFRMSYIDLLQFVKSKNKVSYAPSMGATEITKKDEEKFRRALESFNKISVREENMKKILTNITGRTDIEVVLDPTFLLNANQWEKVMKRPEQLKSNKYILTYFLGEKTENEKRYIEQLAKERNCDIINLLDKNSEFYQTGPSEFLYLEKNATLICTDSFHSCVFSIIFHKPFIVFDRKGTKSNMNSRIETLLKKFNLKDRKYNNQKIDDEIDFIQVDKKLDLEKEKSMKFLINAL